jgi:hypothetical protein
LTDLKIYHSNKFHLFKLHKMENRKQKKRFQGKKKREVLQPNWAAPGAQNRAAAQASPAPYLFPLSFTAGRDPPVGSISSNVPSLSRNRWHFLHLPRFLM